MASWSSRASSLTGVSQEFADPFLMVASESMPDHLSSDVFDYFTFLFYLNEGFREASAKRIAHFVTEVEFVGKAGDKDEQDAMRKYLRDVLKLYAFMNNYGIDYSALGNAFAYIYVPFDRVLEDKRGPLKQYSLGMFERGDVKYNYKDLTYTVPDPLTMHLPKAERTKQTFPFCDNKCTDSSRIKLKKLDPRFITILPSHIDEEYEYIWRFDTELLADVKKGALNQVNKLPIDMLRAIANDEDFLFGPDQIFQLRTTSVSGISNSGWGLPPVLANYRNLHQCQVYRKIDEAIGLDFMLPFRIFSPDVAPDKVGDTAMHTNMMQWKHSIRQMIQARRRDPFAMHAMPMPVKLTQLGGTGKELVPKEVMSQQQDILLDGAGFPAEMWHGTLKSEQMPAAVRVFEGTNMALACDLNCFVKWVVRRISDYLNLEQREVQLMKSSLADDMERRQLLLQLTAGGELPRSIGYRGLGVTDAVDAIDQRAQEDIEIAKLQDKRKQDYAREQQQGSMADQVAQAESGGGGAAGGAPMGSGGGSTPLDIMDKAQSQASEWLKIPSDGDRTKAMQQVEQTNPQLYALAKQKMEEVRSQGASQGRAGVAGPPGQQGGQ